jgi:hypothetical protein
VSFIVAAAAAAASYLPHDDVNTERSAFSVYFSRLLKTATKIKIIYWLLHSSHFWSVTGGPRCSKKKGAITYWTLKIRHTLKRKGLQDEPARRARGRGISDWWDCTPPFLFPLLSRDLRTDQQWAFGQKEKRQKVDLKLVSLGEISSVDKNMLQAIDLQTGMLFPGL